MNRLLGTAAIAAMMLAALPAAAQQSVYDTNPTPQERAQTQQLDTQRWDAFYGYRGFRDVDRMHGRDLLGRRVSARGGDRIGRIRRVAVSTGSGTVWIDADDLRFDPINRVVDTDLSRREVDGLKHMPRF